MQLLWLKCIRLLLMIKRRYFAFAMPKWWHLIRGRIYTQKYFSYHQQIQPNCCQCSQSDYLSPPELIWCQNPFDISENSFRCCAVKLSWLMHIPGYYAYCINYVRPCVSKIDQRSNKAATCWCTDLLSSVFFWKFFICSHWSFCWLAVSNPVFLQQLLDIFSLWNKNSFFWLARMPRKYLMRSRSVISYTCIMSFLTSTTLRFVLS